MTMNARTATRVALVTGASSGLGQATAKHLAARGDRVYGASRRPSPDPDRAWNMLPLDVRDDGSVGRCVETLMAAEGRIDVLVNSAGHAFVGAVEETSLDDMKAQIETNFLGAFRMMRRIVPIMRGQRRGCIVNISSVAGVVPYPFLGAYSASKHALEAISEALALELRNSGVRLALIEPEGMNTSIAFHHPGVDHLVLAAKRREMLRRLEQSTQGDGGHDPSILAEAVAEAIDNDLSPLRTVIGDAAKAIIEARRTMPSDEFGDMIAESLDLGSALISA